MNNSINPQKLYGIWTEGFALDLHTISSVYIGDNEYGHAQFDNKRSKIGELIYNFKYKNDYATLDEIIELALPFLERWLKNKNITTVIPVPFSKQRKIQPVFLIAEKIAFSLNANYKNNLLVKESEGESKNQDKSIIIKPLGSEKISDNILLVDDILKQVQQFPLV